MAEIHHLRRRAELRRVGTPGADAADSGDWSSSTCSRHLDAAYPEHGLCVQCTSRGLREGIDDELPASPDRLGSTVPLTPKAPRYFQANNHSIAKIQDVP